MYTIEPKQSSSVFALVGFVALPEWTLLTAAVERRLQDRPTDVVVLECGRLTGLAPGAFLDLGRLLRTAPGRVRLRNWPAPVARAVIPQLLVARVLDGLLTVISATALRAGEPAPKVELEGALTDLAASIANLKRTWLGGATEPGTGGNERRNAPAPS